MATVFNFSVVGECKAELQNQNSILDTAKGNLVNAKQKAENVWEGEAKDAFKADMDKGIRCLGDMIDLLKKYHTALESIETNYNSTEKANLQIING